MKLIHYVPNYGRAFCFMSASSPETAPVRKPAPVAEPIIEHLRERWSTVAYRDEPVSPETLRQLFEAARWSPSSNNDQPWRFIVATKDNPTEFDRLLRVLNEKNQAWAKNAPVLVLTVARTYFGPTGQHNRHAYHDVGAATANLTAQATSLGLSVHPMAGYDVGAAHKTYGIPGGYEPVAMLTIGYPAPPDTLPPNRCNRANAASASACPSPKSCSPATGAKSHRRLNNV